MRPIWFGSDCKRFVKSYRPALVELRNLWINVKIIGAEKQRKKFNSNISETLCNKIIRKFMQFSTSRLCNNTVGKQTRICGGKRNLSWLGLRV